MVQEAVSALAPAVVLVSGLAAEEVAVVRSLLDQR